MRVCCGGQARQPRPEAHRAAHRSWREQPQQPMGLPAGYLPAQHEAGLQNSIVLLFKAI